jgi:hypothetical protein
MNQHRRRKRTPQDQRQPSQRSEQDETPEDSSFKQVLAIIRRLELDGIAYYAVA